MKTKIKRHSRSVISVLLAVCMLVSCMTVGLIATDAAKVTEDSTVGWNPSTDKFRYQVKPSGGSWGGWQDADFSSAGVATFTIAADGAEIEFMLVFNGTTYKYDSSQSQFTASQMRKTNGTESRAKSNGNGTFKTTGVYAGTYTVTLIDTPNNGEQRFKISGEGGNATCTTTNKYIITGSKLLTNPSSSSDTWQNSWSGAGSRNQMVYNSTIEMYKVEYTNIALGTEFQFRILNVTTNDPDTSWDTTRGYGQATVVDESSLLASGYAKDGGNNNVKLKLTQNANITVTYTDADDVSKPITVTITPAACTVTAGTCTGGSVTVTGGTNVAYGNTVGLTATPAANYHFKNWVANDNLVYASATSATTSANVYGTTEVTALFEGDSFNIIKASDNYTMTAPSTAQYTKEVTISATPADGYIVESVWYSTDGGTTKTTAANGTFTMPAGNVTVGAVVHPKTAHTIEYGVVDGQSGWGYVSVGEKYNSNTTIKRTIASGSSVYENVSVNFGARPAEGYKFVGWYPNPDGSGEQIDDSQDYNVTGPSGNYYAKFAAAAVDPLLPASNAIRLMVRATGSAANDSSYVYAYHKVNNNDTDLLGVWNGKAFTALSGTKTYNGNTYYYYDFANTNSLVIILNDSSGQTANIVNMENGKTYILTYSGGTNKTDDDWGYSGTTDPDIATTTYYPIVLNVENGEYGTTYTNTFAEKSKTFTVNHTPDAEHKAALEKTGYTGNAGSTSTTLTMPDEYAAANKVTVTYNEKQYYPVNFSAGPNGSIKAWIGNSTYSAENAIKSGTKIKEGETVYFEATPKNSSYAVDSWVGFSGTSTTNNLTVDGDENVKVFFKYSDDGEAVLSDGPYFRWDHGSTVSNWAQIKVKDGRAFGYIDNPGNGGGDGDWWCFSVANDKTGTDHIWTYSNVTCVTDFDQYVQVSTYNTEPKLGMARVKSGKPVSRLIIDLGSWNGTSFSLDYNTFRVIPVYDTDNTNIDVYAKKGSYRGDSQYDYFPGIVSSSTLSITSATSAATNVEHHANFATGCAKPGDTVNFSVTIDNNHKDSFYIRGFSINGVTPALYDWNNTGTYSVSYVIPSNFSYDYLEITPIYYQKDAVAVEFYIENYDDALQATGWGNTLSVYPYYFVSGKDDLNASDNAFGGYPGQPVIYYGGRRFIQIPTTYTMERADRGTDKNTNYPAVGETAIIKGITLSNDYWDIVHREYVRAVDQHLQTYDYDDFYKIYKETSDGQEVNKATYMQRTDTADQITFAFKYRDQYDNFGTKRQSKDGDDQIPSTITKSTYTNGWEPLLDYHDRPIDLFGKILTEEEQKKTPLLAVSNGYEYTHAGYYATTWTIYRKNGSSYSKIGTITPSALEISSKTRLDDRTLYPNSAGRGDGYPKMKQLGDYSSTYNTLKTTYANTPVEITYERVLSNYSGDYYTSWGEKSNRSDGRWYYSYYHDDVHANIRIEYKNDESESGWTVDPFKGTSNQGTVTGGKAYFTNADTTYKGKTETGTILSDPNSFYEFEATPAPGYVFAGWWFERDGIVTNVNEDLTKLDGKSQMTSNATFVARYIKNPSGTLTINHKLGEGSVGSGKTYVKLEAINKTDANDTQVITTGTEGFAELTGTIGSKYISYKSGYKFKVTLKTVTGDEFTVFDRFSADENSADFFSTANMTSTGSTTTDWFEIDVDDLFTINAQGFPEQTKDILDYYSYLKAGTYKYHLKYAYDPYVSAYGRQTYEVNGTFTYKELTDYMVFTNGATGSLTFKNDDARTAFLNKMAPYENNFMQNNTWITRTRDNLDQPVAGGPEETYSGSNSTLNVQITSRTDLLDNVRVTLYMPYDHGDSGLKHAATVESDGKVHRATPYYDRGTVAAKYNQVYSLNSVHQINPDSSKPQPEFMEAPFVIFSQDANDEYTVPEYFRYWSVKKVNAYGSEDNLGVEYTRCYSTEFNYVLFTDVIVEPIYTQLAEGEAIPTSQSEQSKDDDNGITIAFIENSRNQYNNYGKGDKAESAGMPSSRFVAGDRIYTDFLLSFNNVIKDDQGNVKKINALDSDKYKVGMIIETVDDIQKVDGEYVTKTNAEYQAEYGATLTEISSKLSGSDGSGGTVTVNRENELKDFVNYCMTNNQTSQGNFLISQFSNSELDNKNRIRYFYTLPNRRHNAELTDDLPRRFKVYRAYAYIKDIEKNNITISQSPVYFTIYDIGSIQNAAEATKAGGYNS